MTYRLSIYRIISCLWTCYCLIWINTEPRWAILEISCRVARDHDVTRNIFAPYLWDSTTRGVSHEDGPRPGLYRNVNIGWSLPVKLDELCSFPHRSYYMCQAEEISMMSMNDPNKFDVLVDQISKLTLSMTTNTDTLNKLFRKVDDLEKTIAAKDQKIKELEERIDDLEQYSRKNNLVVNGLDLHSYSHVASGSDNGAQSHSQLESSEVGSMGMVHHSHSPMESHTMREKFVHFIANKMGIQIPVDEVTAIHDLPTPRNRNLKKPVLVQLSSAIRKAQILSSGKKLKGTNIYINEHLTSKNSKLYQETRLLKKDKKIWHTWTRNCNFVVKHRENDTGIHVKSSQYIVRFQKFQTIG